MQSSFYLGVTEDVRSSSDYEVALGDRVLAHAPDENVKSSTKLVALQLARLLRRGQLQSMLTRLAPPRWR